MARCKCHCNPQPDVSRFFSLMTLTFAVLWMMLLSVGATRSFSAPESFSELAATAKPGVVNIRTVKTIKGGSPVFRHFFGAPFGNNRSPFDDFFKQFHGDGLNRDFKQRSLGSGFIVSADGYIVTNNHVIENADQIKVILFDKKEFDAELVGRDPKTDLALIQIRGVGNLKPLRMGDSDKLEVGTWVVAIGSPFGLEQTVTAGIVSAKGRIIGSGPYDDFIQTDASINPGNSGGPLINMDGEVVGINTAIVASGQGIGFAIPVNMARGVIGQLKDKGEVTRGWLGVAIQDLTPELAEYYGVASHNGVLVTQVFDGDPADKAGIKVNDILLSVDGKTLSTGRELSALIANSQVGHKTKLEVIRDGKKRTVTVTLVKREDDEKTPVVQNRDNDELGLVVADVTSEFARRFGLETPEDGVLVVNVKSDSLAEKADIRPGDIIKEIDRTVVKNRAAFFQIMKKNKDARSVQFLIKRPNVGYVATKIQRH
ncbi:DegQ family serine endoprotease [Desulfosarcina sp. OttesenSCG-928-G10]|nr:DegQ family serine endoprotease [Desulfosarcina sp. OttesenSCG-928-G10]MDL2321981.1 DegQ family serine endoprotease [Desulfosarcina sp. OttesenSCG-928-B08]